MINNFLFTLLDRIEQETKDAPNHFIMDNYGCDTAHCMVGWALTWGFIDGRDGGELCLYSNINPAFSRMLFYPISFHSRITARVCNEMQIPVKLFQERQRRILHEDESIPYPGVDGYSFSFDTQVPPTQRVEFMRRYITKVFEEYGDIIHLQDNGLTLEEVANGED